MPRRVDVDGLNGLVASGKKLLVIFSAEWCGQSKMARMLVEKVKVAYPEIEFVEVDVDDNDMWGNDTLDIKVVPTFVGYDSRQTIFNQKEYQIEEDLIKLLEQIK